MRVACSKCQTKFNIPPEKLESGSIKIRCTKCGHVFGVRKKSAEPESGNAARDADLNIDLNAPPKPVEETPAPLPVEEPAAPPKTDEAPPKAKDDFSGFDLDFALNEGGEEEKQIAPGTNFPEVNIPEEPPPSQKEVLSDDDFDLDFDAPKEEPKATATSLEDDFASLDLGGSRGEEQQPAPADFAAPLPEEKPAEEEKIPDLDFDMDDFSMDLSPKGSEKKPEPEERKDIDFDLGELDDLDLASDLKTGDDKDILGSFDDMDLGSDLDVSKDLEEDLDKAFANEAANASKSKKPSLPEPEILTKAPIKRQEEKLGISELDLGDFNGTLDEEAKKPEKDMFAEMGAKPSDEEAKPTLDLRKGARKNDVPAREGSFLKDLAKSKLAVAAVGFGAVTLVLFVLGALFSSGSAFYFFNPSNLGRIMDRRGMHAEVGPVDPINGAYLKRTGKPELYVVSGWVKNNSPAAKSAIEVSASLFDARGNSVANARSFCGNTLTRDELSLLTDQEITQRLARSSGDGLINLDVAPGATVPFMVVFFSPPALVAKHNVEVVSADKGGKSR